MMKVVIWGLRTARHSHRYIHKGFFETFQRMGHEVVWVDDKLRNQHLITDNTLVFAVNIASKFLIDNPNAKYVLHNIDSRPFSKPENIVNLQVYTNKAVGADIGHPVVKWDSVSRTLYQPWGISIPREHWRLHDPNTSRTENWIGAVWNNNLNQGNEEEIFQYRLALKSFGYEFKKRGGTRSLSISGISDLRSLELVRKSPVGAAIVGNWQKENAYIPCRIFKNVAAGKIPISNSNLGIIFEYNGIFADDYRDLIGQTRSLAMKEYNDKLLLAQDIISDFTYESNLKRILRILNIP